jgi:hypothetical protein
MRIIVGASLLALLSAPAFASCPANLADCPSPSFNAVAANTLSGSITATGSTTARTLADRAADVLNVKDFGAALDGTTNDNAALQAARGAATKDQTIYLPDGKLLKTVNPTAGPSTVLWHLDGTTFPDGISPVLGIGAGDVVETAFGGGRFLTRQSTSAVTGPLLRLDATNTWTAAPLGGVAATLAINTNPRPGNTQYSWGINSIVNAASTGGNNNQDVAVAGSIFRTGAGATWQFFGQTVDSSGVVANASEVGFESGIQANGPETASTVHDPSQGGRAFLHLTASAYLPPVWQAGHAYAAGAVVQPTVANGFTYVVQTPGTSSGVQPTWPVAPGTVTDGGVTWAFGTTIAMQVSRGIDLSSHADAQMGAGIFALGPFYDAPVDLSWATLTGATAAGVRLAPNMPVDFSGGGTAITQNLRTMRYDTTATSLTYRVSGSDVLKVGDTGNMILAGSISPVSVKWASGNLSFFQPTSGAEIVRFTDSATALASFFNLNYISTGNWLQITNGGSAANVALTSTGGGIAKLGPIATGLFVTSGGEVGMTKITDPNSAVGAGFLKLTAEAGTNAGSCKIVARAGTSATPVTIVDNVGAGC